MERVPKFINAAVLRKINKPLSIEKLEIPQLKRGQVLVKIEYSGVCHSQLMEYQGKRGHDKYLPHLLGHEGSGRVVAINKNVTKVRPGDSVILGWIKGDGIQAEGAKFVSNGEIVNAGPVTTFSDYSIVSENRLVPLPASLPKDIAVLFGCAIPTGAGIVVNQIKPEAGSSVAVLGLGGIGLSSLLALNIFDLKQIIALDINKEKLKFAEEFGATHLVNTLETDPLKEVLRITNGLGVDYCIEATGKTKMIQNGFSMVKKFGGKCIFASHPPKNERISIDPFDLISGKEIKGSWGGSSHPDSDIPIFADYYNKGLLILDKLVKKTYKLNQINEAFNDLENGKVFRPIIRFNDKKIDSL
mgnify:CR=1 FL=1